MADINIFTFLNQIQSKQRKFPYDKKIASAWMLTQWLSHDKTLLKKCNDINKYQSLLSDKSIYEYYMSVIPSGKRFIKWTKKRKENEVMKKRIHKLKEIYPDLSIKECKIIISNLKNKKKEKK